MSGKAQQQSRLKELIARGREQGYLTYAEVNDHLPEDISDPEQVEDASHFADEEHLYSQLLVALIEAAQKNPGLSSMQLIARWHGTEQGRLLRALAEKEWLIVADNLEQQFFDTITSLSARQRERSLEQLLRKSRQSELTSEEKTQLLVLLSRNVPAQTPTSSGA